MAHHAFEPLGDFHQFLDARLPLDQARQRRGLFQRFFQGDVQLVRDELGDAVRFAVGKLHGPRHVLQRGFCRHGPKRDDLRHVFPAVLLRDVVNHFAAAVHAEINVNVGQGNALRIQEALEEQIVLQRVEVGDPQRIGHEAPGRRAASGADRNLAFFGEPHEVPDNQKVAGKLHLLNRADLALQAFGVLAQAAAQQSPPGHLFQTRPPRLESLARDFFKIAVVRLARRNLEIREGMRDFFDAQLAPLRDLDRARDRLRHFREDLVHFFGGLHVELVVGELHALGVAARAAGLDAEEKVVGRRILFAEIVGVVGHYQRNVGLLRQLDQARVDAFFLFQALVLHFEKKIPFSENVLELIRDAARFIHVVGLQSLGDFSAQAARERNQALRVAGQQVLVHSRLVIKTFEIPRRDELNQVAVALLVGAEQHEVVIMIAFVPEETSFLGDVGFAADDRLQAPGRGGLVELHGREQVPVVRDRQRLHSLPESVFDQRRSLAGSV